MSSSLYTLIVRTDGSEPEAVNPDWTGPFNVMDRQAADLNTTYSPGRFYSAVNVNDLSARAATRGAERSDSQPNANQEGSVDGR